MEIKNSIDKTRQSNETNYPCQDMPKRIGNLYGDDRGTGFAGNVWNKNAISPTITTCQGGGREPMILDSFIVAMRGRNPEHPTDRTPGIHTEQRLEMNKDGLVNTLTTVQKDNLCLEKKIHTLTKQELVPCKLDKMPEGKLTSLNNAKLCDVDTKTASTITSRYYKGIGAHKDNMCIEIKQATKEGSIKCKVGGCYDASYPDSKTRRGRVQDNGDTVPTLTASSSENINYVETVYRIRKLTPKECFRLMSFRDEDYEAASKVNSNTQLYKQAGNSICECVLKAIFSQLGIKGVPKWNDTH